jgi:hypothetical protein
MQRRLKIAEGANDAQVQSQADNRLRDLGANTDQHHLSAEQPPGQHCHNQALRHLAIDHRHSRDIQQQTPGQRVFQHVQRLLVQLAQVAAIQRADQRHHQRIGADRQHRHADLQDGDALLLVLVQQAGLLGIEMGWL